MQRQEHIASTRKESGSLVLPEIKKLRYLPSVEADRFLQIIRTAITKILLVGALKSLYSKIEENAILIGREASEQLKRYVELSDIYEKTHRKIESIKSEKKPEPGILEKYREIHEAAEKELKFVSRKLTKNLMREPELLNVLNKHKDTWCIHIDSHCQKLANLLEAIYKFAASDLQSPELEYQRRKDYIQSMRNEEFDKRALISDLQRKLASFEVKQLKMLKDRATIMGELRNNLYKVKEQNRITMTKIRDTYLSEKEEKEKSYAYVMYDLKKTLKNSQKDLEELKGIHGTLITKIKRNRMVLEDSIENIVKKRDMELAENKVLFLKARDEYLSDRAKLTELQRRLEPLKKEYDEIMEAKAIEEERLRKEEEEYNQMQNAATFIQAYYYAHVARRANRKLLKAMDEKLKKM